jgi:hypothetical protein
MVGRMRIAAAADADADADAVAPCAAVLADAPPGDAPVEVAAINTTPLTALL